MSNVVTLIENFDEILEFKWKDYDIPYWAAIRWYVLEKIIFPYVFNISIYRDSKVQSVKKQNNNDNKSNIELGNFLKNLSCNPLSAQKADIIIFNATRFNIYNKNGKCYFSTMSDYFANACPKITIIFEMFYGENMSKSIPRCFEKVYSRDILELIINLESKKERKGNYDELDNIRKFLLYVKFILKKLYRISISDNVINYLGNNLIAWGAKLHAYEYYYKKFFELVCPKIVFGSAWFNPFIVKFAKDMGIKTAEIQHGIIHKIHPGYNYGKAILNSKEYKKLIPDYMITYGKYWNNNFNRPTNKASIGKPHLVAKLNEAKRQTNKGQEDYILIVSQPIVTHKMIDVAKFLARNTEYRIIFRPHPKELSYRYLYSDLKQFTKVFIDEDSDIYDLIIKSKIIIGHSSTTLFEAIPFNKTLYILKDRLSEIIIPKDIGYFFSSVEELYALMNSDLPPKQLTHDNIQYYWDLNWKENYQKFLQKIL